MNVNSNLKSAKLVSAASKPNSLGVMYKFFFMLESSDLVSAEVYIETHSKKITLK
jgi:hypothetical protein